MKKKSSLLLFLQLLFIFLFLISGPWFAKNTWLFIIELLAIALGAWAVVHMVKKSKFRGSPVPAQDAHLLETGSYKYIRNPMYSGIILGFGALLLDYFTTLRLSIFILEVVVLLKKMSIEEKLLPEKFKDYASYKSRTRRLIPFIY